MGIFLSCLSVDVKPHPFRPAGGGLGGLGVAVMGAPRAPCALRLVVVLSLAYSGHAQTIRARKQC